MASYTPGPWTVRVDRERGYLTEIAAPCCEHPNCGKTIVFIHRDPTRPFQSSHGEHMEANAHLIAAAPDLYEALKLLLANIEEYQRINHLGGEQNQDQVLARAALAKAEGRP